MEQAGLRSWQDAAGNQCGRREGVEPGLPALLLGSHLDTVPDAGSYDGMLGVVMAIAVAERLRERELPFALEVVGFSDEEGTRFGKALLGSQAVAGVWEEDWWDLRDRDGHTLHQAFLDFGLDPRRVGDAARRPDELVGYLEAHIEQGPYLEAADRSLGYVTTIAGARRFRLSFIGEARHAGGTPYPRRRDALVGASEAITPDRAPGPRVRVHRHRRPDRGAAGGDQRDPGPRRLQPRPARGDRRRARRHVGADARGDRGVSARRAGSGSRSARPTARRRCRARPGSRRRWSTGIRSTGDDDPIGLWSRAGHDAMAVGLTTDVGMLFVRCHDGISHHPEEDVRELDVAAGLDALEAAVLAVASRTGAAR